ncbi:uncharacterized protein [Centruroides vittatus]|uniref:uncharacterized protein n=1 Tax=Centruroides vittatus TaxID=120091 RepID=UPI00350EEB3A
MNTRIFFIILVALCCIFLTLGRETGYDFKSEQKNNIGVNNFDNQRTGFENILDCMNGLNRTYERLVRDAQMKKCCAETLNDSYNIWFLTFHYCLSMLIAKDYQYCLNKTKLPSEDQNSKTIILDHLKFEKDVMDRIYPRPKTAEECDESFIQSYDNAHKEQCKVNTNKNLDWVCKACMEEEKSLL